MEHRYRLHEAFKRAADQWRSQLAAFAKISVRYGLHDLCKPDKHDSGAGLSPHNSRK